MNAEDLFSALDFENRTYYYHITERQAGDSINEEGLAMAESHIWSTMIEIKPELVSDVISFLETEHDKNIRKTEIMVIIGIDKGDEEHLVRRNDEERHFSWNEEGMCQFYVPESNILGYIDLTDEDYSFTPNPNCYAFELEDLFINKY